MLPRTTDEYVGQVTREFGFDMGHMLADHRGACHRPHGHRYRLEVTVNGQLQLEGSAAGMVLDFAVLRDTVNEVLTIFDHRFAVALDDPRYAALVDVFDPEDLVVMAGPPTAENLAVWLGGHLAQQLAPFDVAWVRLWETPTCSAWWSP